MCTFEIWLIPFTRVAGYVIVPTIENGKERYIRVCILFFLFSTQN